ncbi:hypothetical protein DUNSADRAFT_10966 [Dunaliella salina]|uniref:Encoded protein n=1 Tax=Dunaliella salina TaxID=3046 RepID=A0ABQ7GEE7_DUNSA|nr:hypothetical protein DUNSADRAFT_10966 [Dunaliella salina]|eukprot:KAF5832979.1 hypothetical protein DUNSADRAFT_10966 [Dunaliella salina]
MMLAMLSVFSQLHSQLVNETEVSQTRPDEDRGSNPAMNGHTMMYRREYGGSLRHPAAFSVPPRRSRELHRAGRESALFGMPPLPDDPPTSDEDSLLKSYSR